MPRALVFTSTLHALSDLFGCLWRAPSVIAFDEAIYPIARWCLERAALRGARLRPFRHLDPRALRSALAQAAPHRAPPWVITDGLCAGCGRAAPLGAYRDLLRPLGGQLVLDDAQAMGLYGRGAARTAPYGQGGGGSLARAGLAGASDIVVVASLAKALGAPLAIMAGARPFIARARGDSETLFHCSPPAEPVVAAARAALAANRCGALDPARLRLAERVRRLRLCLRQRGFVVHGGLFPMQRVPMPDLPTALAVHDRLLARGVRAVVRRVRCLDEVSVTFVVNASHDERQLEIAAEALAEAYPGEPRATPACSTLFSDSASSISTASSNLEA